MKSKTILMTILFLHFLISGCGGGRDLTGYTAGQTGSLKLEVNWPESGDDLSAQVIQDDVVKIQITITGNNISSPIVVYINKNDTGKTISDLPEGNVTLEFKGMDSEGRVLSSRITDVTVTAGETLSVTVILGVSIVSTGFYPSTITLSPGDTLVFVNNDTETHSFSVPYLFTSGNIAPGGSYSFTFDANSLYTYTCTREDGKKLYITIKGGLDPTPTPADSTGTTEEKVIFVDDANGSDPNGDGSITKPYKTLDKGVNVADQDSTVSLIYVRSLPEEQSPRSARDISGGEYNPDTSLTIRSNLAIKKYPSDPNQCIIDFSGATVTDSGFILNGNNTVEGLTIENAAAGRGIKTSGTCTINKCIIYNNNNTISTLDGGGIYVNSGTCYVNYCGIISNYAGSNTGYGGGIYVNTGSSCCANCCCIADNQAAYGSGIASFGTCTVIGNTAGKSDNDIMSTFENLDDIVNQLIDGEISPDDSTLVYFSGANNSVLDGGAIYNKGTFTMSGSLILKNKTDNCGGGIYNAPSSTCTVSGSYIMGNSSSGNGGSIYNSSSSTCTVSGNTCIVFNTAANGGGIYNNGGTCAITDTTITTNKATDGGGIYNIYSGSLHGLCTLKSVNICANKASDDTAGNGGGIYNSSDFTFISDVIIDDNEAEVHGGGIYDTTGMTDPDIYGTAGNKPENFYEKL
jgi:plastocyanin